MGHRGWSAALACVVACGCGRYGYDPIALAVGDGGGVDARDDDDAGGIDAGGIDAGFDAPPALGAFGAPAALDPLNGAAADDPSLTADLLEIYFKSTRGPGGDADIWRATRATAADPFGAPAQVAELSSNAYDGTPEVSSDGLVIYLASARAGGAPGIEIYRATRANRAAAWGAPLRVVELSSSVDDFAAVPDGDETYAVVGHERGGSGFALFESRRGDAGAAWPVPTLIVELDDPAYDADAALDPSATVIYFGSRRAGGAGGVDLWTASRASVDDPFEPPVRVEELATAGDDEDPWISPDLRTLVFTRNAGDGQRLFVTTR